MSRPFVGYCVEGLGKALHRHPETENLHSVANGYIGGKPRIFLPALALLCASAISAAPHDRGKQLFLDGDYPAALEELAARGTAMLSIISIRSTRSSMFFICISLELSSRWRCGISRRFRISAAPHDRGKQLFLDGDYPAALEELSRKSPQCRQRLHRGRRLRRSCTGPCICCLLWDIRHRLPRKMPFRSRGGG